MEPSFQLDESETQQPVENHNQFQFTSVISPKGRRLTKGLNTNTASHQSLAYSNSTYNKNQFTERSPPMFSMDSFSNNQNVNTMNFRPFDRKESTFGSGQGLAIQFDKIKEESYLDSERKGLDETLSREKIDFPCFLSNQNSPNNKFNFNNNLNDSLNNQEQEELDISQRKKSAQGSSKKYKKITPSSRKQIKQSIVKSIKEKIDHKEKDKHNSKQRIEPKPTKSTKLSTISSRQSHQKSTNSLISNEQKRSKSPLQVINKSSSSFYKNPDDISALKQKIKELEYSLQVESISTEQLRTKVSVLNELLEEKFLERNGINFKLFKNSSPSMRGGKSTKNIRNTSKDNNQRQKDTKSYSNIDLYVEMKMMEKSKQQIQIEYERLRNQLAQKKALLNDYAIKCQQLQKQLCNTQKSKNEIKTQTSFNTNQQNNPKGYLSKQNSQTNTLNQTINLLQQQKQTFIKMIQTQKNLLKQKDTQIFSLSNKLKQQEKKSIETQSYIKLFQQKQKRFTQIERPKFITQIKDLSQKLDNQREHIERLEMENNLIQMQLEQGFFKDSKLQGIQSPQGKLSALQKSKFTNEKFGSPELSSQRFNNALTQRSQLSQPRYGAQSSIKQLTPKVQNSRTGLIMNQQQQQQNEGIPDAMTLIMHQEQELKLLKNERDYFREQNEKYKQMEKDNYKYKVQIEDLRNQVQSLRQIISLDDSCTF